MFMSEYYRLSNQLSRTKRSGGMVARAWTIPTSGMPANTGSKEIAETPATPGKQYKKTSKITNNIRVPATTARPATVKTLGTEGTPRTERIPAPPHEHAGTQQEQRRSDAPTVVSATERMPSTLGTQERGWILAKAGKKAMSERLAQKGRQ